MSCESTNDGKQGDDARFVRYWGEYCYLEVSVVYAKWGLRGLFVHGGELYRSLCADNSLTREQARQQCKAEVDAAVRETTEPAIPVDTVPGLRVLCNAVIEHLHTIAKWHQWRDNPVAAQLWEQPKPPPDYSPDNLIREVWAIMRALPGQARPPLPTMPLTVNAATSSLDAVIGWCETQEAAVQSDTKTDDHQATQDSQKPILRSERVLLFGRNDSPVVDGKPKPLLTKAQYDVIRTLIEAGLVGLSKDQLIFASKHGGAVTTLRHLRDDSDWADVLPLPGRPGRGYRIL